jgi:serine/threonine-protein kinase
MGASDFTKQERLDRSPQGVDATTVHTLRNEEAARASAFGRTIVVLCVGAMFFIPFLPGERWLRIAMMITVLVNGSASVWVWRRAREPGRYDKRMFRLYGVSSAIASLVVLYYTGIVSAGPVVIMLGIGFFGQGDDRRWALGFTIWSVVTYIILATLVITGVVPELGLFRGLAMPMICRIFAATMLPYIFIITIWQARLSRRATVDAVQRLGAALRAVQEREALLQEANQNIDAVIGGGAKHGAYSGRRAGEYLLAEVIGRGAMGEVYAASHAQTGVRAAIKLLTPSALADPDLFQRFMREADILRRLSAPNVIAVYDVGRDVGGAPYIAMELLDGHDLAWSLRHGQKLQLTEVVELARQVARGLDSAHHAGIVHRDLKPQNLFRVDSSGTWKILDFGVAKLGGSEGTLTRGAVIGTPGYMSPEQARGIDTDTRADIFSLAAVVYRVITGRPPFSGADLPEAVFQVVFGMPARPSELAPGLPRQIDDVLAIALAKQSDQRFATAAEFADALRAASQGSIAPELSARAAALLDKHPWGHRAGEYTTPPTARPQRRSVA